MLGCSTCSCKPKRPKRLPTRALSCICLRCCSRFRGCCTAVFALADALLQPVIAGNVFVFCFEARLGCGDEAQSRHLQPGPHHVRHVTSGGFGVLGPNGFLSAPECLRHSDVVLFGVVHIVSALVITSISRLLVRGPGCCQGIESQHAVSLAVQLRVTRWCNYLMFWESRGPR